MYGHNFAAQFVCNCLCFLLWRLYLHYNCIIFLFMMKPLPKLISAGTNKAIFNLLFSLLLTQSRKPCYFTFKSVWYFRLRWQSQSISLFLCFHGQTFEVRVTIDDGYLTIKKTFGQFELIHKQLQKHFIASTLPQWDDDTLTHSQIHTHSRINTHSRIHTH